MNFFDKEHSKTAENTPILTFTARQLSLTFAGILLIFFFIFIAGYFLGKKNAAEQFLYKIEQESLADQIYSSVCVLSDKDDNENGDDPVETLENADEGEQAENSESETSAVASANPVTPAETESKEYYRAQLAGFATEPAATRFAQSLKKKGYAVEVAPRYSIRGQGKKVTWYQVVTKKYEQKLELMAIVNNIKKSEHLNDVKIVQA